MRARVFAAALLFAAAPTLACAQQAIIAPDTPLFDSTNRIVNTRSLQSALNNLPLAQGKIFIGNASNVATAQTPSGDCTISLTGVITCAQSAGNFHVLGTLTVDGAATFNNGVTVNGSFVDRNGNATISGNLTVAGSINPNFPANKAGGVVWWSPFGGLQATTSPFPSKFLMSGFGGQSPVWTQTTWADSYAASALLYSNGPNNIQPLATANSSVLATNSSGVPAYTTTLPNGLNLGTAPTLGSTGTGAGAVLVSGTGVAALNISGGSGAGQGATLQLTRATVQHNLGSAAAILGGTSDDFVIYGSGANNVKIYANNNLALTAAPSGGVSIGATTDPGAGILNVLTGFRIGNAAASGNVLRGNGTNFVSAALAAADLSNGVTGSGNVVLATAPAGFLKVVKVQKFTAGGTYTPSTGIQYAIIECVGGGAGGGGVTGTAANFYVGGGGGAGSYSRAYVSAATIGASQTVTIGGGGNGGAAGSNAGSAGTDTSVGTLCVGKGGSGGNFSSVAQNGIGGAGGVAGTGDFTPTGAPGAGGFYNSVNASIGTPAGLGGSSIFGGGGTATTSHANGVAATSYGSGGSGGSSDNGSNFAGGNGSAGVVVITEFTNQ